MRNYKIKKKLEKPTKYLVLQYEEDMDADAVSYISKFQTKSALDIWMKKEATKKDFDIELIEIYEVGHKINVQVETVVTTKVTTRYQAVKATPVRRKKPPLKRKRKML